MVSYEYVENVVYPPKNPVITNNFHLLSIGNMLKIFIKKPIRNEPMQFTKNVPSVNLLPKKLFIFWVKKYRNNAPVPPPITM